MQPPSISLNFNLAKLRAVASTRAGGQIIVFVMILQAQKFETSPPFQTEPPKTGQPGLRSTPEYAPRHAAQLHGIRAEQFQAHPHTEPHYFLLRLLTGIPLGLYPYYFHFFHLILHKH